MDLETEMLYIGFSWICENVYGYSEQEIVLLEKKEIAKRRLKLFD
jgi:hypothetical protein